MADGLKGAATLNARVTPAQRKSSAQLELSGAVGEEVRFLRRLVVTMRWNLLWLPFPAILFLSLALFDALEAYKYTRVVIAHWTWGLLLSPAAALWVALELASIALPVQALLLILTFFHPDTDELYEHRARNTVLCVIGAPVAVFVIWVLIWGSFPLENGADGVYMRMIPFIPWPSETFF